MVTGASTADCAVMLVDARKGVLTQTRRHSYLVSLLGIRHVVLAVNKMDLVGYSEATLPRDRGRLPARSPPRSASTTSPCIPISALRGRQRRRRAAQRMPWYDGPTLMEYLETVEIDEDRAAARSRSGCRCSGSTAPTSDFRGFAGTDRQRHACGRATRSSSLPSGAKRASSGSSPTTATSTQAVAGQSVTLTLADEIDVSRGDVIAGVDRAAERRRPVRGHDRLDGRRADAAADAAT